MKTTRGRLYYTAISDKELKSIIRESILEVLTQELMKFRALLLPSISKREQQDIERRYDRPSRRVAKIQDYRA